MPRAPRRPRASTRSKPVASILEVLPPKRPEGNDADTLEFLQAIDHFKRATGRQFPTWTEVLQIVRSIGYQKVSGKRPS